MQYTATTYQSPIGELLLVANNNDLVGLYLPLQKNRPDIPIERQDGRGFFDKILSELDSYFCHKLINFKIQQFLIGTEFQQKVWHALGNIEYSQHTTYSDIARAIHRPNAVRAVAMAISKNPISIIVPCHRVIGKNGNLTGYAGGLDAKKYLLCHEKNHFAQSKVV